MRAPLRALRALLLFCAVALPGIVAAQQVAVPELRLRITDLTGTLTGSEKAALEQKLAAYEGQKGSQIVVLMLPNTGDETIEEYGIRVAQAWKIGRAGVDDGVILLVAKEDRRMRIEVGYGLEGALPDAIAKRIVADTITPYFRSGDYYMGIAAGIDAIIQAIQGEPLPEARRKATQVHPDVIGRLLPFVIAGIVIGFIVRVVTRRGLGALVAALVAGIPALVLLGLGAALIAALFAFAFVLGAGNSRRSRHGFMGGFGGPGGGFGGGFGGSSGGFGGGGGGGFGGGGASGGW